MEKNDEKPQDTQKVTNQATIVSPPPAKKNERLGPRQIIIMAIGALAVVTVIVYGLWFGVSWLKGKLMGSKPPDTKVVSTTTTVSTTSTPTPCPPCPCAEATAKPIPKPAVVRHQANTVLPPTTSSPRRQPAAKCDFDRRPENDEEYIRQLWAEHRRSQSKN